MTSRTTSLVLAAAAAVSILASTPTRVAAQIGQLPAGFHDEAVSPFGLFLPVDLAFLPDGRILFVEYKRARLRMVVNGAIAANDPLATIDSVKTMGPEEGLLSVAVDPRWPTSPYVYVLSTALDSTIRLSRLTLSGDLSDPASGLVSVVPGSRREILRDIRSVFPSHNGGTLRFAPDSMLWASFGEDALHCQATDSTGLFGVICRLDVRGVPDGPGPPDKALLAPPDNPYAGAPDPDTRLMYARGFRNPFRFSIDAPTGRVFVGDVGATKREEIDVIDGPAKNYGWPWLEGSQPYAPTECGPSPPAQQLTGPIVEYDRGVFCGFPSPPECQAAVIGGVVMRHVASSPVSFPPVYEGQYFYLDYYGGRIWRLVDSLGTWVAPPPAPAQPNPADWGTGYLLVSSLVLGRDGAIYFAYNGDNWVGGNGQIRRIVYFDAPSGVAEPRPGGVELAPVYPSPTHGATTLRFVLAAPARVRLTLHDAQGRRVRTLLEDASSAAGEHRVTWDGRDDSGRAAPPGVYLARLDVDGAVSRDRCIALVR